MVLYHVHELDHDARCLLNVFLHELTHLFDEVTLDDIQSIHRQRQVLWLRDRLHGEVSPRELTFLHLTGDVFWIGASFHPFVEISGEDQVVHHWIFEPAVRYDKMIIHFGTSIEICNAWKSTDHCKDLVFVLGIYEGRDALHTDLVGVYFIAFFIEILADDEMARPQPHSKEGEKSLVAKFLEERIFVENVFVNADAHLHF